VTAEVIARLPKLQLIATRSTGYDHIDVLAAKARNITVSTVPAYGVHTVSEFAFALLLTLSRNILPANERVVEDGSFSSEGLTGFDLAGKTLGVLGTGRIGKNLIRIAKGFSMNVIAYDVHEDTAACDELGYTYVPLEKLWAESDIISLHLPESVETNGLINKDAISKMKRGVVIINTARGTLVDTEALVWGLEEKIIAAAGLDVLAEERYVADEVRLLSEGAPSADSLKTLALNHYLIDHPRVLITPHMAFNTKEALLRILDTTVDTIESFTRGEKKNTV
jgi:D-lactate dehydrogenase